jgi:hypothetical protein
VNKKGEREKKEAAVLWFDILFWPLPKGTEEIFFIIIISCLFTIYSTKYEY